MGRRVVPVAIVLILAFAPDAASAQGITAPEVAAERLSGAEPQWTEGRYYPTFPSSDELLVIPVTTSLGEHYFPDSYDPSRWYA